MALKKEYKLISIIGGSGFIGSKLADRLSQAGYNFKIVDKVKSFTYPHLWKEADVRDKDSLLFALEGSDVIYNLAAAHRDDIRPRSLYWDVNVRGAENVCSVAEELGITKIIFTSSVAVYGFTEKATDERGELKPFNEYGRTKLEAEKVYREWQKKGEDRTLIIIRLAVVFGEGNRGNVYNLLNHIINGHFVMIGNGKNVKSMAYVENVAAFLEYCLKFGPGFYLYNYVDKPDFDMDTFVKTVYKILGKNPKIKFKLPYWLGLSIGKLFDIASLITGKKFPISSIRIKKFCSNTCFNTTVHKTGFIPPFSLYEGLERTIRYEFIEKRKDILFYSE